MLKINRYIVDRYYAGKNVDKVVKIYFEHGLTAAIYLTVEDRHRGVPMRKVISAKFRDVRKQVERASKELKKRVLDHAVKESLHGTSEKKEGIVGISALLEADPSASR